MPDLGPGVQSEGRASTGLPPTKEFMEQIAGDLANSSHVAGSHFPVPGSAVSRALFIAGVP